VKAQAHAGGRGKAGFIKLAETPEQARDLADGMLGQTFKGFKIGRLLIEEAVSIAAEYYLAITIDRSSKSPIIMVSGMGGIDIEEVAATSPEKIARLPMDVAYGPFYFKLRGLAAPADQDPKVSRHFVDNPKRLYPVVEYQEEAEEDPIEAEAHRKGVTYVRLGGDIGIIGNGAGIVMTTLDIVTREGGKPANFLDIGGGARADHVRQALSIILMDPNVKGILFNIFGGITRGDEVAKGVLEATSTMDINVPIVLRMAGTRAEEGLKLLEGSSLVPAADPVDGAWKVIALAKGA
jgi:succinyl-CoA synthetase beta subunit